MKQKKIDGFNAFTLEQVRDEGACYSLKKLKTLWAGRKYVTCHDVLDMDISLEDKRWFVSIFLLRWDLDFKAEYGYQFGLWCGSASTGHDLLGWLNAAKLRQVVYYYEGILSKLLDKGVMEMGAN